MYFFSPEKVIFSSGVDGLLVAKYTLIIIFSIGCCEPGPPIEISGRAFFSHKKIFFFGVYFYMF